MNTKILFNFLWKFAERCGSQIISFIVVIALARVLKPEDYGSVALITVFISILQVFVDSGLGTALVQKKDADDIDFSSVFYFNIVICLLIYLLVYFGAPYISEFYNLSNLSTVIRVLGLRIIISGVRNIQQAYVSRNMMFKRFFISTFVASICSAIVGIMLAYMDYGIWALVAQQLINEFIGTFILWLTIKWRPILVFSYNRLKALLSFGWMLLISALLENIYNNMRSIIIGKLYTTTDLAFYNQGQLIPNVIINNISASIDSILLPVMSKVQDDTERIKAMTVRAIKTSTYLLCPLMIGIAFCAESIIKLILTDKWLGCVSYLRIFCLTYMFFPIHTANLNAIKAMGRSDLFLKLEVIKKFVGLIILFGTMHYGVLIMAYSMMIHSFICQLINSWPNRRLLGYKYIDQLKDILPNILLSTFAGCCTYIVGILGLSSAITVLLQLMTGLIVYLVLSILFRVESYEYIRSGIRKIYAKVL